MKARSALVREEAEKATTQAREAVVLLERARTLLTEDNPMQLAMKHIDEVISEAESRAGMLARGLVSTDLLDSSGFRYP